jgi:hypothetical protein
VRRRPSDFAAGGTWRPSVQMAADAPARLKRRAGPGQLGLGAIADDGRWVAPATAAVIPSRLGHCDMTRGAVQARGGRGDSGGRCHQVRAFARAGPTACRERSSDEDRGLRADW